MTVVCKGDTPMEWEKRGTVLGILASVLATAGSHIFYLILMFGMMKTERMISCKSGGGHGLGFWGAYACDYTKAYLECFPELALTVCLLIVGRNLLQTRLYYGLLMRGSVLQYRSKSMFKDALVGFFLWCYAHCWLHLLLLMWLIWQAGFEDQFLEELRTTKAGRNRPGAAFLGPGPDPRMSEPQVVINDRPFDNPVLRAQVSLLVDLVGFFVIPSSLFFVYLLTGYDVEMSFVPMSQYFFDARKTDGVGFHTRVHANLSVLNDDAVRLLVLHKQDEIHDAALTVTDALDEIVRLYERDGQQYEDEAAEAGQSFVGISRAHWPCRLLVSEDASSFSGLSFRALWLVFVALSLILHCFLLVSLFQLGKEDVLKWGNHGHAALHLAVVLVHIGVVVFGVGVHASSVVQWLLHDLLRRREHEKNWIYLQRHLAEDQKLAQQGNSSEEFKLSDETGCVATAGYHAPQERDKADAAMVVEAEPPTKKLLTGGTQGDIC